MSSKFNSLSEAERIKLVKNRFVNLVQSIAFDNNELKKYVPLPVAEKEIVPALARITEIMSPEDIVRINGLNNAAIELAKAANAKAAEEFKTKENIYNGILNSISKLGKKEPCICNMCFNINITNGPPEEFDPLIDVARQLAEKSIL